jgi:hypothetical protein
VVSRDGNGEWGGRVVRVALEGSNGRVEVSGDTFRTATGLRSTWFGFSQSPIMTYWQQLGGPDSVVGALQGTEYAVGTGTGQRFERGDIYHSSVTGPHALHGRLLTAYRSYGGPTSRIGFPTTDVQTRKAGIVARFERGGIYARNQGAPFVVAGVIHTRYVAAGWIGALGWPASSNYTVTGGERVDFAKGSIVWNRSTGRTSIIWK